MKLNKVVSTLEMPHEEWLRYRKKGIGGDPNISHQQG